MLLEELDQSKIQLPRRLPNTRPSSLQHVASTNNATTQIES
jgi:hypothetical protein